MDFILVFILVIGVAVIGIGAYHIVNKIYDGLMLLARRQDTLTFKVSTIDSIEDRLGDLTTTIGDIQEEIYAIKRAQDRSEN